MTHDDGAAQDDGVRQRQMAVLQRLNEAFFSANPGAYFRQRALALAWDEPERAGPLSAEVAELLPGWELDPTSDREEQAHHRTVDTFALAQHAGESLLRHFFAQLDSAETGSPWLSMASLRSGRDTTERLHRLIAEDASEELADAVELAFLPSREDLTEGVGPEPVEAMARFAAAWLQHFAREALDAGSGYNAVKHGLGSVAGNHEVSVASADLDLMPEPLVMLRGATVETLEYAGTKAEGRSWFRVLRAVDVPGQTVCALIAAELLDALWEVGRARFLGGGAHIRMLSGPLPADIKAGREEQWGFLKVPIAALPMEEAPAHLARPRVTDS